MAAALASRSTAQKAGLAIGAGLTAGVGAYYITQSSVVSALQVEKDEMETKVFVAQGKRRRCESTILESDSLIKALQQQSELDQKSLTEIIQELEAARVKVAQLEAQQQQKESDLTRMQLDMQRAAQQRQTAKEEIDRFTREAALAEKALAALNDQVAAAQQQLNPLNHPKVRSFFKGQ